MKQHNVIVYILIPEAIAHRPQGTIFNTTQLEKDNDNAIIKTNQADPSTASTVATEVLSEWQSQRGQKFNDSVFLKHSEWPDHWHADKRSRAALYGRSQLFKMRLRVLNWWHPGWKKALNQTTTRIQRVPGPAYVDSAWLLDDLFLHQDWVKYLQISFTFCFNLAWISRWEGFTASEQFKECLVSCQSHTSKFTLLYCIHRATHKKKIPSIWFSK